MSSQKFQARQGDVHIYEIDAIPSDAKPIKGDKGGRRIVLAYGEVTGHAHAFIPTSGKTQLFEDTKGRYLNVGDDAQVHKFREYVYAHPSGRNLIGYLDLCCHRGLQIDGSVMVREFDQAAEVLTHEEHGIVPLMPGWYEVPIQREYTPLGDRPVVD